MLAAMAQQKLARDRETAREQRRPRRHRTQQEAQRERRDQRAARIELRKPEEPSEAELRGERSRDRARGDERADLEIQRQRPVREQQR